MISKYILRKSWSNKSAYLLIVLPLLFVLTFSYFPIMNGLIHIFYRWNGDNIREFVGFGNIIKLGSDSELLRSFGVVGIFILSNLVKMIPSIAVAVVIHRVISEKWQYLYRLLFVIPMVIPFVVLILLWKYFYEPNNGVINELLRMMGLLGDMQTIQWLSDKSLVLFSIMFSCFPWVGSFGVLIYLTGLQNISNDIYEAARIDGAGAFRVFWNVELPLITTQIRINLVLMIINTLRGWEYVYLFLGEGGGPDGIATVPGLLLFREAFGRGYFGYGCAIGFVIFMVTLLLTYINNKFVRIDK